MSYLSILLPLFVGANLSTYHQRQQDRFQDQRRMIQRAIAQVPLNRDLLFQRTYSVDLKMSYSVQPVSKRGQKSWNFIFSPGQSPAEDSWRLEGPPIQKQFSKDENTVGKALLSAFSKLNQTSIHSYPFVLSVNQDEKYWFFQFLPLPAITGGDFGVKVSKVSNIATLIEGH